VRDAELERADAVCGRLMAAIRAIQASGVAVPVAGGVDLMQLCWEVCVCVFICLAV